VSLNLLADRATRVRGLQLSVGVNWVDEELRGVQLATIVNISNGPVTGVQASAGANLARGPVRGVQVTDAVNLGFAEVRGVQAAAGANYVVGDVVGLQTAAGFNLAMRNLRGLQAGAGANWASRDLRGLQLAVAFNGAGGALVGAQAAVVNYGHDVTGAQVGIVNVAGVSRGLQLGLVNISDEDRGVPIGLVSYARKNGMLHMAAYGTETSPTNLAFKIGGRNVYNTFALGYRPGREGNRFTSALGLGVRARLERPWLSFLDTEVVASNFTHNVEDESDHLQILSSLRLMGGWRLARRFAIVAGPTVNVLVRKRDFDTDIAPGALEKVLHDGPTVVSLYPGFVLGVEI
jgi:hypothetical protein